MVININRWTPDTCGCTVEYTWDSEEPQETRQHTFFAVVEVCEAHQSLATKVQTKDHGKKIEKHTKIIADALQQNIDSSSEAINKAKFPHHKKQLMQNHVAVQKHNADIQEEYDAILSQPHVHDEHIYDIIAEENQRKNKTHFHLLENNKVDINEAGYHWEGPADNRVLVPDVVLPDEEITKLHDHFDKTFGKNKVRIAKK